MLWTASSLKLSSYICPGQHRAAGGITMLFSFKVLYLTVNTIDGTTINLYLLRLHIQHCERLFEPLTEDKGRGICFGDFIGSFAFLVGKRRNAHRWLAYQNMSTFIMP